MTITAAVLAAAQSGTNGSSRATASISPAADKLLLVAVMNRPASGASELITLAGCGITWTQVATITSGGLNGDRLTCFRGSHASPTPGALTATADASQDQDGWSIAVIELTGVDLAQGDQGVIQFNTGTGTTSIASATLAAFASATNAVIGVGGAAATSRTWAAEGGHTELVDLTPPGYTGSLFVGFLASQDTTPSGTISGASGINWGFIGIELAEEVAPAAPMLTRIEGPSWRGTNRGLNRGTK